jgi:hypothetical protein
VQDDALLLQKCQDAERREHRKTCQEIRSKVQRPGSSTASGARKISWPKTAAPARPVDAQSHPSSVDKHRVWVAENIAELQRLGLESTVQDILEKRRLDKGYQSQLLDFLFGGGHPYMQALALVTPEYPPHAYLSHLTYTEAVRQLVDSFRLRMTDEYVFNAQTIVRAGRAYCPVPRLYG